VERDRSGRRHPILVVIHNLFTTKNPNMTYKDLIEKLVQHALETPTKTAAINVTLSQHCGVINAFIYSGGYIPDAPIGHTLTVYDTASPQQIALEYATLLDYLGECPHTPAVTPLELAKTALVKSLEALQAERLESARLRSIIKFIGGQPIE